MSDSAGTGLVTVRQPFAKPSCLSSRINNSLRLSTWLETSPHLRPSKVCKLLLSSPVFHNGRKDFRGLPRLTRTRIRARSVSVSVQLRGRVTRAAYTQFSFLNKSGCQLLHTVWIWHLHIVGRLLPVCSREGLVPS